MNLRNDDPWLGWITIAIIATTSTVAMFHWLS